MTLHLARESLLRTRQNGRYCRGCERFHAVEDFSVKDARKGTLRSRCRICCREASRRHYTRTKGAYLERNRRNNPLQRQAAAVFVYQFLLGHPCVECGEADPVVLEFNHLDPSTKSANLSDMIANGVSLAYLRTEIAKCEVLCANCHQRRTILSKSAHYKVMASTAVPGFRLAANLRNSRLVLERLAKSACIDCGIVDWLVLQFDHRGEKTRDIGWFVSSGSPARRVADELDKCDVRCANCHRRRTAAARGWFRARQGGPNATTGFMLIVS